MRILYLDIDTLRPDHLGCYGYGRNTSPNINAICEESIRFDNCYASDAPCLPSRSACWTGRFGIHTGVVNHGGLAADPIPMGKSRGFLENISRLSFVSEMRLYGGMHTVTVSPFAERHQAWWFYAGFKEIFNPGRHGRERADEVVPIALDWLDRNSKQDNWFLHVNVWDPHTRFRTPMEYGEPFADADAPDWLSEERIQHQRAIYGPHGACEVSGYKPDVRKDLPRDLVEIKNRKDYIQWINGYDTGISYAEMWIGKIIDKLKGQGIYDDTVIIVSADHGENHGELGVYGDHQTADRITCRVPYILRFPGITDGGRTDHALHYQADLSATVLELLGLKVPREWDGVSFAQALKAGEEKGREEIIVSNMAWSCQRGVLWDNWLAIRTYHTGFKAFPRYMLFDIQTDPHETTNLARTRPEILAVGMQKLEKWTADMLQNSPHSHDPLWTVMKEGGSLHANNYGRDFKEYINRLRLTGRDFYADWLDENKGNPLPDGSPWAVALEPGQQFLTEPFFRRVS
ncbi:MAG: sulfatase [Proteobacteria bacterium]|nr:sulfatase [Pseudomonadota bacterium]MBU4471350.1 sulfatase [Pseudomonadota bacterium]MCG2751647.1 sulfatase [Desulfobacteraceae bacterium]